MADTDPNKAAADFDPSEAERRANEWRQVKDLADVLMAGFVEDKGHVSVQKYFEPDSQEERAARTAMARVLRSGLPLEQDFLDRLAALFDPREDTHPGIDRRLIFEDRKARRRTDHIRNTEIAIFIADHVRSDYVRSGRRRFVAMAEEARVRAMQLGQPAAAAVTAITALAKLSGKWIERSEQTTKTGDLSQLTDGELEAIIRSSNGTKSTLN